MFINLDVNGYIKFWHYHSQSCLSTIVDNEIQPLNLDLNFNCDRLAVSGYSGYINVYDVATKKLINTLESRLIILLFCDLMELFDINLLIIAGHIQ